MKFTNTSHRAAVEKDNLLALYHQHFSDETEKTLHIRRKQLDIDLAEHRRDEHFKRYCSKKLYNKACSFKRLAKKFA